MSAIKDLVMPHETVVRKLDRMAREMLEVHYNESTASSLGSMGKAWRWPALWQGGFASFLQLTLSRLFDMDKNAL